MEIFINDKLYKDGIKQVHVKYVLGWFERKHM